MESLDQSYNPSRIIEIESIKEMAFRSHMHEEIGPFWGEYFERRSSLRRHYKILPVFPKSNLGIIPISLSLQALVKYKRELTSRP